MAYVFYDTETTGTDTTFDQILQFAALLTDADSN
jgi:exodeoxyribonuclease-1